jgi:5'-3' exonuclease
MNQQRSRRFRAAQDAKEKIIVGKYVFILGDDAETDKDLRKLAALIKEEGTHY